MPVTSDLGCECSRGALSDGSCVTSEGKKFSLINVSVSDVN